MIWLVRPRISGLLPRSRLWTDAFGAKRHDRLLGRRDNGQMEERRDEAEPIGSRPDGNGSTFGGRPPGDGVRRRGVPCTWVKAWLRSTGTDLATDIKQRRSQPFIGERVKFISNIISFVLSEYYST